MADFYTWAPKIVTLMFVFAFGACVGSLINVLVYRLPRGIGVVRPSSRCPTCQTKLTWRENIPILGWVLLRGKCRFCGCRISPEYPIVELVVAVLFAGLYALWYIVPGSAEFWGQIKPEWARSDEIYSLPTLTWPAFVVLVTLVGSLVAMTLVDAKTFTIPLVLTWVPAAAGLLIHPLHAFWFEHAHGVMTQASPGLWRSPDGTWWDSAPGWQWTIPTPLAMEWRWVGGAIGGGLGLILSNVLLRVGLIRRSFEDYEEWEAGVLDKQRGGTPAATDVPIGGEASETVEHAEEAPGGADLWIQYPHARREMVREMAFLAPPVAFAFVGAWLLNPAGGPLAQAGAAPLWVRVLAGALLGYLVGGGIVWAVRVLGSLAFGKEAMGLGDVHLMAAVGACLGWIDATVAFFGAAFVGLAWAMLGRLAGGKMQRAMPYGPFLAVSTLLVIIAKPGVEALLSLLLRMPINIP